MEASDDSSEFIVDIICSENHTKNDDPKPSSTTYCLKEELENQENLLSQKKIFHHRLVGHPTTTTTTTTTDLALEVFEEDLENDVRSKQKQSKADAGTSSSLGVGSHAICGPSSSSSSTTTPRSTSARIEDMGRKSLQPTYMSYFKSEGIDGDDDDHSSSEEGSEVIPQDELPSPGPQLDCSPQPGAFAGAPGSELQRLDPLSTHQHFYNPNNPQRRIGQGGTERSTTTPTPPGALSQAIFPDDTNDTMNIDGLVEALPVDEEHRLSGMMEAQPLDEEDMPQEKQKSNDTNYKRLGCGIIIVACLVIALSLGLGLTHNEGEEEVTETPIDNTSSSHAEPLIPIENLETLYDSLPVTTKENLNTPGTHQQLAWEWLRNHPDVDGMAEWRKKQLFAMATFFYSFEGPLWPKSSQRRWMNPQTSECSWVLTEDQLSFYTQQSMGYIGPIYTERDYRACNPDGELQTLILPGVVLYEDTNPTVPPQIGLLTSLRIFGTLAGNVNAKLSDIVIPELIQLPNFVHLNLHGSGIRGVIPIQLGLMTGLRHLALGDNPITGTIPTQFANLSSLEYTVLGGGRASTGGFLGLTGTIPTVLGLMTKLTGLVIYQSSINGHMPTELGHLTNTARLNLWGTNLTGPIPSQLGLLTNMESFYFINNALTGSVPSQLGLMTKIRDFELGNDVELPESSPLNDFSGSLPTELWKLSHMKWLVLSNLPNLSGSLPTAMWELSHLEWLLLSNLPNISGSIPKELRMPNLTDFSLSGSPYLAGTISDQVCIFVEKLDFDCSEVLCGCDCRCAAGG